MSNHRKYYRGVGLVFNQQARSVTSLETGKTQQASTRFGMDKLIEGYWADWCSRIPPLTKQ